MNGTRRDERFIGRRKQMPPLKKTRQVSDVLVAIPYGLKHAQ